MKPKHQPRDNFELFQAHFDQLLNHDHELVILAKIIDWGRFDAEFAQCYSSDNGAPAKATRLMVGLQYLKFTFNQSDESLIERWIENPYWQYFCGFTHMQHECPIHPTCMTKWRNRIGAARLTELLKETVCIATKGKQLPKKDLEKITVDTTVQEKNITFPTDSKLLLKGINKLVKAAKKRSIKLRQSFIRVAKRAAIKTGRYAHAKQFKRMKRETRQLRTYAGRLIRDIKRKATNPDEELTLLLENVERIRNQMPKDTGKLYSLHEPDVQCISKGKAHKRYEFGQKISLATTNKGDWFVAAELMPGNPYDGHTLAATVEAVESVTGVQVTDVYVDKGYRGHDYTGLASVHLAGSSNKGVSRTERARRKRRSAIEPKIGHAKHDHRMNRCFLKGLSGDAINAVLSAAGANLRKLLGLIACADSAFCFALTYLRHKLILLCSFRLHILSLAGFGKRNAQRVIA